MENRNALIVDAELTGATGYADETPQPRCSVGSPRPTAANRRRRQGDLTPRIGQPVMRARCPRCVVKEDHHDGSTQLTAPPQDGPVGARLDRPLAPAIECTNRYETAAPAKGNDQHTDPIEHGLSVRYARTTVGPPGIPPELLIPLYLRRINEANDRHRGCRGDATALSAASMS